jgi:hypothetical protein
MSKKSQHPTLNLGECPGEVPHRVRAGILAIEDADGVVGEEVRLGKVALA